MPELSSFYSLSRDISHNCNLYDCLDLEELQNLSLPHNCLQLFKAVSQPHNWFLRIPLQRSQTQDANLGMHLSEQPMARERCRCLLLESST